MDVNVLQKQMLLKIMYTLIIWVKTNLYKHLHVYSCLIWLNCEDQSLTSSVSVQHYLNLRKVEIGTC